MLANLEPITCKCGRELGKAFVLNGVFVGVLIGGVVVDESLHGKCAHCRRGIHLAVNRKAYLKLMEHFKEDDPFVIEIGESI